MKAYVAEGIDPKTVRIPTPSQKDAIEHDCGPALVLAGPGSGKTSILIWRYERLIREGSVPPERILLLTFGRDAATQLRHLIRIPQVPVGTNAVKDEAERATVGEAFTFHSFAMLVVREFGGLIGLPQPTRALARKAERWKILAQVIADLRPPRLDGPEGSIDLRQVSRVIEDAKKERVEPARLAAWAAEPKVGETALERRKREMLGHIARVYDDYVRRNRARGEFDFDDFVLLALELLEREDVREEVQHRYDYVMVDEYQDTSDAQALLADRVAGDSANILVVADDDQSIYKFRGASRHNVLRFQRRFPGCAVYPIKENRRSTPQIVRVSLSVMAGRPNREPKELDPVRTDGHRVRLLSAPDADSEALAVAHQIAAGHAEPYRVPYSDFAILARTRAHLTRYARALRERNIPFVVASREFFRQPEIKDTLALLAAAVEPDDDLAVLRLMGLPRYAVGRARFHLVREGRVRSLPLRDLGERARELGLGEDEARRFEVLLDDVDALGLLAHRADASEVLHEALARSRYVGLLDGASAGRQLEGAAVLRKLVRIVEEFCATSDDPGLVACLEYLDLLSRAEDEDDVPLPTASAEAVRLSTIHSAKGLEFPHVFVVELMEGQLPLRERRDELELPAELVYRDEDLPPDSHEEEERRLFYVGVTRAMDTLTITRAREYYDGQDAERSRFLDPLTEHPDTHARAAPVAALREPAPAEEAPWAFELEDLSYSHLATFRRCPRRFAYAYYYGYPARPQAEPLLGQLVHEALYLAGLAKQRGEALDGDALESSFDTVWDRTRFDKRRFASLRDHGRAMLHRYGDSDGWRDSEPDRLEHHFNGLEIGQHTFSGQIDRIDRRRDGGRRKIVDYKTGRPKLLEQIDFDDRLQLALYEKEGERLEATAAIDLELHFLQDATVVPVVLDDRAMRRSLAAAQSRAQEIRTAIATMQFPPRPSHWNCDPCAFRPVCDEGRLAAETPGTEESVADPRRENEIPF